MPETRDEVTTWVGDEARHWKQRYRDANAAIEAARALHTPITSGGITICAHCSGLEDGRIRGLVRPHPCPTLTALAALHSSKETTDARA